MYEIAFETVFWLNLKTIQKAKDANWIFDMPPIMILNSDV